MKWSQLFILYSTKNKSNNTDNYKKSVITNIHINVLTDTRVDKIKSSKSPL
jgi:hypothetical protein